MIIFLVESKKKKCKLEHIKNWLNLFVDYHNRESCLK
jgi:hypothetical protein